MTIQEAVDMVDRLRPNHYDFVEKVRWLSKLDGMVYQEVYLTHADCPVASFEGYDAADPDTELLMPFPYGEDVYNYFLQAQIDRENGEFAKYNQSITMYNNSYRMFVDYWNRTHRPLPLRSAFLL